MTKLEKLRLRYMSDPLPVRLGGLAANLARVAGFLKHDEHQRAVLKTLQESKWFIEWLAADQPPALAAELVGMQVQIALWQRQCSTKWADPGWRSTIAARSRQWSQRILDISGLLRERMDKDRGIATHE